MHASGQLQLSELLDLATSRERRRAVSLAAVVRVVGAALFLTLALVMSQGPHAREFTPYVPMLGAYSAVALVCLFLRRRPGLLRFAWVPALLDLGALYGMQIFGMDFAASRAAHANFTVALVAVLIALSALILRPLALYLYATVATAVLVHVMWRAGEPPAALIGGCFVLLLMTVISENATRRQRRLAVDLAEAEVSRRLESRRLAETQQHNERLERLQREKDSLVQLIVHDLRSPLNAVMLSLEYVKSKLGGAPADAEMREAVEDAGSTAQRLSGMVAQILDTARLEEGRLSLERTTLAARDLLERARHQLAPMARDKKIDVQIEASVALSLRADARLLGRVLENLLSNSIRHTPNDGRVLLAAARDGDSCRLSVHNTGPAIAEDDRVRIFDKFQQGDNSRLGGWGLGLYFCRMVVEAHGGRIAVEDLSGWTASFVLRLPAEATVRGRSELEMAAHR